MTLPPTVRLRRTGTHRLVPSKYADDGDSVLALIADDPDHLQRIFELDAATNDRLLAPERPLPGLDPSELTHRGGDWTILAEAASPDGSFRRAWRCDFRDGVFLSAAWLDKAE